MKTLTKIVLTTICGFMLQFSIAQKTTFIYDLAHGENAREAQVWKQTILDSGRHSLVTMKTTLTRTYLRDTPS
jgi:hypothetical protein